MYVCMYIMIICSAWVWDIWHNVIWRKVVWHKNIWHNRNAFFFLCQMAITATVQYAKRSYAKWHRPVLRYVENIPSSDPVSFMQLILNVVQCYEAIPFQTESISCAPRLPDNSIFIWRIWHCKRSFFWHANDKFGHRRQSIFTWKTIMLIVFIQHQVKTIRVSAKAVSFDEIKNN